MSLRKMTLLYMAFLLLVIVAADSGWARPVFRAVQKTAAGDKFFHFLLFGLLAFMCGVSFEQNPKVIQGVSILPSSVFIFLFVVIEEASQIFLVNRSADIWDLVADVIGITLFDYLARRLLLRDVPSALPQ